MTTRTITGRSDCDHVLSWALGHPWAITRPMLSVVAHVLGRRLVGKSAAEDPAALVMRQPPAPAPPASGAVAIIPLHGVLAPRINMLSDISGGATFEEASAHVQRAAADPQVGTIVLDWDSPGGSVAGATEFAQVLLRAREQKRVISVANHQMCSAAYWTGSCATEVVATPSALVGSIGVYCLHEDLSAYLEKEGIALTYISAGKYKVDGNPTEKLSETAHARMQAIVDYAYAGFTADVASGRHTSVEAVRTGMGEGHALTAAEALAAGLVDRIATLESVIHGAATAAAQPAVRRSALTAEDLKLGRELAALGLVG